MKQSYLSSHQKHFLRERIIPEGHTLVGLGGPDIREYTKFAHHKGYNDIRIWENNPLIYSHCLSIIADLRIQYNIGDIINAPILKNCTYDLDFCCTIKSIQSHIEKFTDNFILTISEMRMPKLSSLPVFANFRGERLRNIIKISDTDSIMKTNKGEYFVQSYCDTSPMLIIKPITT